MFPFSCALINARTHDDDATCTCTATPPRESLCVTISCVGIYMRVMVYTHRACVLNYDGNIAPPPVRTMNTCFDVCMCVCVNIQVGSG